MYIQIISLIPASKDFSIKFMLPKKDNEEKKQVFKLIALRFQNTIITLHKKLFTSVHS